MGSCTSDTNPRLGAVIHLTERTILSLQADIKNKNYEAIVQHLCTFYIDYERLSKEDQKKTDALVSDLRIARD